MSLKESKKRKTPKRELENEENSKEITEELSTEPQTKLQKIRKSKLQSNLTSASEVETVIPEKENNEVEKTSNLELPVASDPHPKKVKTKKRKLKLNLTSASEVEIAAPERESGEVETSDLQVSVGSCPNESKDDSEPSPKSAGISIKFRDKETSDLYTLKFLKFISKFAELEPKSLDDLTIEIYINDAVKSEVVEEIVDVPEIPQESPKKRKKKSKAKKELFMLDVTPSTTNDQDLLYENKFTISAKKEVDPSGLVGRHGCFNCGECHNMRDCPMPKDYSRINQARNNFKSQLKTERYHVEEQFGHLKPGSISNELRNALGLRKNETPHYIYMMRTMGYPPGWLEEAKFINSNLNIFDFDGNDVQGNAVKKAGLDPEKIVDFPGFNVPFEKGMKDEYRDFGVPPYSENYSKEAMINYFDQQFNKDEDNFENCDQAAKEPKPEPRPIAVAKVQAKEKIESPSLPDLEKQKQQLLDELKNEDKPSGSPAVPKKLKAAGSSGVLDDFQNDDKSLSSQDVPNDSNKDGQSSSSLDVPYDSNKDDRSSSSPPGLDQTNNDEKPSSSLDDLVVKTTCFGTPILKSTSPYMRLPNPDNFSKDVSSVLYFENLPNSTGKYEQMTDVLQKVRKTLKNIQNGAT